MIVRFTLGLALIFASLPAAAAPVRYVLEPDDSTVGFTYFFGDQPVQGSMPVQQAEVAIDFDRLAASSVRVAMNAARARAGVVFATEAMRSAAVLDTRRHPEITFASTAVSGDVAGARLAGNITIRGVTRPVTLDARLYRPSGSAPGDRDRLAILLSGAVDRSDFGASGYPELVADRIEIRVLAWIRKAP
ncbi:MAG: YceI family protein [Rhodobacter sp.]|nr:YceI family protein [Rhodobacter sp.]